MSHAPAGWYPTDRGLRYWDGLRWTEHLAPARPTMPAASSTSVPGHGAGRTWAFLGWGGLALTSLLGAASSGVSGLLVLAATYTFLVGVVALVRGRVRWARLRSRAAAGGALGLAVVMAGVGGATADTPPGSVPVAVATAGPTQSTSTTSTPAPQVSPTTSPSPAPTPTRAPSSPTPLPTATPTPTRAAPARGTALAALAALPVKGRAPKTGYDRDRFGQAWADVDRNGCDTRNDVLRRDLRAFTLKAGTRGCLVLTGRLADPYTGRSISFVRGPGTSTAVQVDHVVALSDAWQKGAQQLDERTRTAFANDPLNLLAVHGPTNQSKGDGDAATWLPPRKAYRCAYVARQVAVKARYHLWVTSAERAAIERVLATCPAQRLPTAKAIGLGGGRVVAAPAPAPEPRPTPTKTTAPTHRTDPRFGTCREANAAGYGPYRSGTDPEYDWYQDRDHDGMVCE